ncbi:MAG: LysM peptidoglycan-binding domain-containing protein [Bacteroidota bacterium]
MAQNAEQTAPLKPVVATPIISKDTLSKAAISTADFDSSFINDSTYDTFLTHYLEAAREHYISALDARSTGDTTKSGNEFERAIADLNELSNFPGIDTSQDFTDLSRSVLEDYEKYIATIDSLGPETSIFALREKLNQMSEGDSSADLDIPKEIISTSTIPLVINGLVEQNIEFFRTRFHAHFEQWLYRAGKYFPRMRQIFKEEGAPQEMIYLCMIESGINPVAKSWAKAVGMWQFMKGTGSLYGLKNNFWYDERCDFEKSARAAARHLNDLYKIYGDWYLVLAAYNSGGGRVDRAIRRSGTRDFWKMRNHLPKQTRNYVPEYIAATVMAMNPEHYGFKVTPADSLRFDKVTVNDCVDLSVVADCAETDATTIRDLNPSILRWCTPPGSKEFTLRLPEGKADIFNANYANLPDDKKHNQITHTVKRRESLAAIANKYGITSRVLAEANHLRPRSRVAAGTVLMIPVPSSSKIYDHDVIKEASSKKTFASRRNKRSVDGITGKEKIVHQIIKGNTLGLIAKQYGVRVSDLRIWNDIPYGKTIKAGEELTIWVSSSSPDKVTAQTQQAGFVALPGQVIAAKETPPAAIGNSTKRQTIRIRYGDSLKKIAKRYSVSIADIKNWNNLDDENLLAGRKLVIHLRTAKKDSSAVLIAAKKDSSNAALLKSYTVKKGDTLFAIAALFGVSVGDLRVWNNIRGNRIKIGQEIKINS